MRPSVTLPSIRTSSFSSVAVSDVAAALSSFDPLPVSAKTCFWSTPHYSRAGLQLPYKETDPRLALQLLAHHRGAFGERLQLAERRLAGEVFHPAVGGKDQA